MLAGFRSWWEQSQYYFNNAIQARWVRIGWKAALRWILRVIEKRGGTIEDVVEYIKEEIKL